MTAFAAGLCNVVGTYFAFQGDWGHTALWNLLAFSLWVVHFRQVRNSR